MPDFRYTRSARFSWRSFSRRSSSRVAHAVIHRLLGALDIVGAENRAGVHARARQLTRALTLLAYGVAALASISLALTRFGVNEPQWNPRAARHWSLTHGVNIVIILVGAFIVDPRGEPRDRAFSVQARRAATRRAISNGSGAPRRSAAS